MQLLRLATLAGSPQPLAVSTAIGELYSIHPWVAFFFLPRFLFHPAPLLFVLVFRFLLFGLTLVFVCA